MILQWLASPEWAQIVKALLHTLWLGALIALVLALVLRRVSNPMARYRCSMAALMAVVVAGLISWSWPSRTDAAMPAQKVSGHTVISQTMEAGDVGGAPEVVVTGDAKPVAAHTPARWTAWMALVWLVGAGLMLVRAGAQVAGAERLRRSCRPLEDSRIDELVKKARETVGLARRLRVVVTDQLTSPAVVGVLVPTLILPLSLVTTLSAEQIRFVLLHELAHIRRGDYLANLVQLFAEALLFFNPAVWWISQQVRREREACCDALAIELSGAPADYARTLVRVAESVLTPTPAAAPALEDRRSHSSLSERVHRLLVPGYRPALRMTWRAMFSALVMGAILLGLSAMGTRVTVAMAAQLLTPQERIDRIEKKMVEYGQKPGADGANSDRQAPQVEVRGHARMADGSALPKGSRLSIHSFSTRSSGVYDAKLNADGSFSQKVRAGMIWVGAEFAGYAPCYVGPYDGSVTNRLETAELVVDRGFEVSVRAADAGTQAPIAGGRLDAQFWLNGHGIGQRTGTASKVTTDSEGRARLTCCLGVPLTLTFNAAGYEIVEERFEKLRPGQELRLVVRRGAVLSGVVVDKAGGRPVSGATIRMLHERGTVERGYSWEDDQRIVAVTDEQGTFVIRQLNPGTRYWLGVSAPGHESVMLPNVRAGQSNLVVRAGPELIVRGRITGDLSRLKQTGGDMTISTTLVQQIIDESTSSWESSQKVEVRDGVGYFQFTNRIASTATLSVAGRTFTRFVDAPVDDWLIDLNSPEFTYMPPKRDVVFRFKHPSGVTPKGTVMVTQPGNDYPNEPAQCCREAEIQNGEVRTKVLVGHRANISPGKTVGYWFKAPFAGYDVTNGSGPMVIDIPVVPAGAIYARARNADGTPAANLSFSAVELKRSPLLGKGGSFSDGGDSYSMNDVPRRWVSGPLPIGGTYQVIGHRDNALCVSKPITLTDEKPDAEVELQFETARAIEGRLLDADGRPVCYAEVSGDARIGTGSYGLKKVQTDDQGAFRFDGATPGVAKYTVSVGSPGCCTEIVPVDFSKMPMLIRLKPGLKLSGQVVDVETGQAVANARLSVSAFDAVGNLPMQYTQTDAEGRFEFNTLGDATYYLYVIGAEIQNPREPRFKAGQGGSLRIEVRVPPGSPLAPKASLGPARGSRVYLINRNNLQSRLHLAAGSSPQTVCEALLKLCGESGVAMQPPVFLFWHEEGYRLLVRALPSQMNEIDRVIQSLNEGRTIQAAGNSPELKTPPAHAARAGSTNLFTRMFLVNMQSLDAVFRGRGVIPETVPVEMSQAFRKLFNGIGVDLRAESGKSLFFSDTRGELLIHATLEDMDAIEALLVCVQPPPQVNIRALFALVPTNGLDRILVRAGLTNVPSMVSTQQILQRLDEGRFRDLEAMLKQREGVQLFSMPSVTTLSGREAMTQIREPGNEAMKRADNMQTNSLPSTGPMLDVIPKVEFDGYTVSLTIAAGLNGLSEFKGNTTPERDGGRQSLDAVVQSGDGEIRAKTAVLDGEILMLGSTCAKAEHPDMRTRCLLVLVAPTIVDPAGNPVHASR
jgi:beta-lactamase regulating signal transducer with metallopeptidase domain/protocatechuate 3,4-dioxygenase beta subunit